MKEPIIEIPRARESWIAGLIDAGILEVTEDGLKCKEVATIATTWKGGVVLS